MGGFKTIDHLRSLRTIVVEGGDTAECLARQETRHGRAGQGDDCHQGREQSA